MQEFRARIFMIWKKKLVERPQIHGQKLHAIYCLILTFRVINRYFLDVSCISVLHFPEFFTINFIFTLNRYLDSFKIIETFWAPFYEFIPHRTGGKICKFNSIIALLLIFPQTLLLHGSSICLHGNFWI